MNSLNKQQISDLINRAKEAKEIIQDIYRTSVSYQDNRFKQEAIDTISSIDYLLEELNIINNK